MELRRELLLTVGLLVALNLSLAFGAIGLFSRMSPAIEGILQENVVSIVAAEEMLAQIASQGDAPYSAVARTALEHALAQARSNVTEVSERVVLSALQRELSGTMEGDAASRRRAVTQIRELIRINRDAMRRVDKNAQRLGSAGAWSAAFIGFVSFVLSVAVVVRLRRRFLRPLEELYQVLEAVRRGESLRRCRALDAPLEVRQVARSVNMLLDERAHDLRQGCASDRAPLEHAALAELLERQHGGAAVVDETGRIVRASRRMLELLAGADGANLRQQLTVDKDRHPSLEVIELDSAGGRIFLVPDLPSS